MIRNILISVILLVLAQQAIYAQCIGTPGEVSWHYWGEIPYYGIDHVYVDDTYPVGPDKTRKINSLNTPFNYDNHYGGVTKGFIQVPQSGNVTFNVTGDDFTQFKLSTDATKENLQAIAEVREWSGQLEYDKFPEQTSAPINLSAGAYYYFELHHREGSGGDHANVYWKTPFISATEWQPITFQYLYDTCEDICPPKGTPCNDNNQNTSDDIEDGYCNCVGTSVDPNIVVGERSILQAYFYPGVSDGNLSALHTHPDYPMMPDEMTIYDTGLFSDWSENKTDYGIRIQGYLTVPTDGCYDFNITGVNEVKFYLSTDQYEVNKNTNTIETRWGTNRLNHDVPAFQGSQTMRNICLEAHSYYYFEVEIATSSWGHFFNVFWNGPQHTDDNWYMIPELYVYDYVGEMVCLPQGSTCDDNNPLTAQDQIDNNCQCAGTPCTPGEDCDDPSASFIEYDYCKVGNEIGTRPDDSWLSCAPAPNPYIAERSGLHWIHYDLGSPYEIRQSHVWNYNVPGYTYQGFQRVIVDYSLDGVEWFTHGTYDWPLASGNSTYTGFQGPNFDGMSIQYIMFTQVDSDATSCRGISKVTFSVDECPPMGTPCDDNNPLTFHDIYDECICQGIYLTETDCERDTILLYQDQTEDRTYHAIQALIAKGDILSDQNVHYRAGIEILLNAGYEVTLGAEFTAEIDPCQGDQGSVVKVVKETPHLVERKLAKDDVDVFPLAGNTDQTVKIVLEEGGPVQLDIYDLDGHLVHHVIDREFPQFGTYYKRIQTRKLENGVYMLKVQTSKNIISTKMTVAN